MVRALAAMGLFSILLVMQLPADLRGPLLVEALAWSDHAWGPSLTEALRVLWSYLFRHAVELSWGLQVKYVIGAFYGLWVIQGVLIFWGLLMPLYVVLPSMREGDLYARLGALFCSLISVWAIFFLPQGAFLIAPLAGSLMIATKRVVKLPHLIDKLR